MSGIKTLQSSAEREPTVAPSTRFLTSRCMHSSATQSCPNFCSICSRSHCATLKHFQSLGSAVASPFPSALSCTEVAGVFCSWSPSVGSGTGSK